VTNCSAKISGVCALVLSFTPALSGASVDATLTLGRKALSNEGIATAWKLAQTALAQEPESAAAHEFSGEVLFRKGDFTQAEREFKLATKLDANYASAWWGLARIAECTSLHKTAAQYFARAYELDPKNPRIFRDWAMRLQGRSHIDALEKYASMADPGRNQSELEDLRRHIQLDQALNGRRLMVLSGPYQRTEIPVAVLISDATHMRTYGLDVSINGTPMRLILDTGASGILIPRRLADRARVAKLSDAAFSGFGDNIKPNSGYHGLADRVRIGDLEFRDALINVSNQDSVGTADGLIGTDVFSRFLLTVDFLARKLRLDPLPGYEPDDEELHDRTVSPEMRNYSRVFRFGHVLLAPTRVNDSREVLFVIDTGSAKTLISYEMAAEVSKINRDPRTGINGINGRVADIYQTGDLFLEFAGFRQKNLGMTAFNMWEHSRSFGTEVSGFLGLPLLNLFTLTIDYRDGLVNFDRKEP
jgi:tetratricopeptide (TPR) repeat protein